MKRPKLDPVLLARLEAMGVYIMHAYQPQELFTTSRKLARCAEADDPWRVLLGRKGVASWTDGAQVGAGQGDTLNTAVEAAIPTGVKARLLALEHQLMRLAVVLRAG